MTFLRTVLDALLGVDRLIVRENERLLVLIDGKFQSILSPGEHAIKTRDRVVETHRFDITDGAVANDLIVALAKARPELAAAHLTEVRTDAVQTAAVFRDGKLQGLQGRDRQAWFWTDAGPWEVETFDTSEEIAVPKALANRLKGTLITKIKRIEVQAEQVALVFVDGVFDRKLTAGSHAFWNVGPKVEGKLIDLRRQALEVAGQELLTKDRVTIRVNLSVIYKVVDPVAAVMGTKDFVETLYREAQFALRRTLGAMSLDQILAEKVDIDVMAVREAMGVLGVEVSELAMKDVILPGEMRDILNKVVAAEKEAEANVIRRREETNATRSLLNTAKVMAENPVMLRLKELEALQELAGKVERLTVHNGTDGLMNDLVKLRA